MSELFHIIVISEHTKIDTLFDNVSQENLISEEIVKKLQLETKLHINPYPLGWVCDNAQLQVTKQCRIRFSITSGFINEVDLDAVPLDICGIVLGSPYMYDRKDILYREYDMYQLTKDGIEYIVHAHRMKTNISLVSTNKMKRLINGSNNFVLIIVKAKDVEQTESFKGCDPKLKKDLIKVVSNYDILFQVPEGFPLKQEFNMKFIFSRMHLFLILVCT